MSERPASQTPAVVRVVSRDTVRMRSDALATEEPLEIRLQAGREVRTVAVTMRTPGSDFELAAGFLYAEGIVESKHDISTIDYCIGGPLSDGAGAQQFNVVTVELAARDLPDIEGLDRHFFTSSACGVCGKASLESLRALGGPPVSSGPHVSPDVLLALPARLRDAQRIFSRTGGLHATGLFDADGELVALREDVGRHNAMDKLCGWALLADAIPLHDRIALVSGRASYELVQKAFRAGISLLCAVSAPSSLAVDVAKEFGMTLVGFLRGDGFNIYAGDERISQP